MPLVSRTFDQLIDFTRTSSATFVNESGNIASTPQSRNLLTFTNEFANAAWTKTNVAITANSTAAPDGTSTADTLTASAGAAVHNVGQNTTISGVACTWSIYAKAGTSSFLQLVHTANSNFFANFNLATGAVGTVGSLATAAITSVGNGWYRCSMTFTPTSGSLMRAAMISSATAVFNESWTAAGTETIFIWGAQLEQASAATDYTRNFGGLFPPRFDYDPVTRAPRGLLIEEQRTNFLRRSAEFDNAVWTNANPNVPAVTANSTVAPDGTTTADTLTAATGGTVSQSRQIASSTGATGNFTGSVYLKAGTSTRSQIIMSDTTSGFNVVGDFSITWTAGVATVQSVAFGTASVTNAGNGWYRCVITGNVPSANASVAFAVLPDSVSGTGSVIAWGAQLEAGAFATSYIPTVASQVTRTADAAEIAAPNFASWYNQSSGSLVVQSSTFKPTSTATLTNAAIVSDGSSSNRAGLRYNSSGNAEGFAVTGGVVQAQMTEAYTAGVTDRMAFGMAVNDFVFVRNGLVVATDTSGTMPAVSRLGVGVDQLASGPLNGWIRSIRYYPTRLTNAQLQALTA